MKTIYIFWSAKNTEEAKTIVHSLLNAKLIACASIIPQVQSIYRWKGAIEEAVETKVILKTQSIHFDAICAYIKKQGSYEVPEIVQIAIARGNPQYIDWLIDETSI